MSNASSPGGGVGVEVFTPNDPAVGATIVPILLPANSAVQSNQVSTAAAGL